MAFELESDAFRNGGEIPARFAGTGENVSPLLRWRDVPSRTQSFALIVEDPDAPRGTFTHWLLWDLPATLGVLAANWQPGDAGHAGRNDFGQTRYGGPLPPVGHGPHRYVFRLYALDEPKLGLRAGASRDDIERAMHGHVLATAELMGRFERRSEASAGRH